MAMTRHRSRFESEVHLGLMVIVFLLLFLNFASNLIIYKARSTQREETVGHLRQGALAVSRMVQQSYPEPLSGEQLDEARLRYGLSSLKMLPSRPAGDSPSEKRAWFGLLARQLPPGEFPQLAEKLFRAESDELTRGSDAEYHYLYPIPAGAGSDLLILTVNRPDLAYLDDSRTTILVVQVSALGIVAIVYALLSQFIFRPFRRIKEQAARAGRPFDETDNETEAIVQEYETIIDQLKNNEAELLKLNAAIQTKADSLEEFNQYLLESSHSGIITFDPRGTIVGINETAVRLLNLRGDHHVGNGYQQVLEHLGELREGVRTAVEDGMTVGYREYTGLLGGRSDVVLGVSISLIKDRLQSEVGLFVLINDLTELGRLRREVETRKRQVALGEMAGGLAHQIRNSLGAISGYGNLIKKQLSREGKPVDKAHALLEETGEAGNLIDRFLSFARPFEFNAAPTLLDDLVEETLKQFRARDDCRVVEFAVKGTRGIVASVDPVLMKQALANVIDNAINAYGGHRGLVEITTACHEDRALVTVEDFGCGIPKDEIERIFTPFFSSRPSGTGLGLPLTCKIMDLHGGRVSVESELGEGTRFIIELPVSPLQHDGRVEGEISSRV